MQIVIDIPEEVLKTRYYTDYFGCGSHKLTETLDNAISLPKKHGRLIDADALVKKYGDSVAFINGRVNGEYINVQTILEPYKEGDI